MKRFLLALMILALSTAFNPAAAGMPESTTHMYYIAADEVNWNYVPGGTNHLTGKPYHPIGYFVGPGGKPVTRTVRTAYVKCLYREYADGSFRTSKPPSPEWAHLGMLGPLIRAEVGDTIRIVYRNRCSFPNSIHGHGVQYAKDSEGAPYDDGTPGGVKPGDAVRPGQTYTYVWHVPERAGPGPNDPSSLLWMYHSHTNEYRDFNSGLIGPMIVTARGKARPNGSPNDVDRELVVWFAQMHEEDSWYTKRNLPTVESDHTLPNFLTNDASATVTYPYFVTFSINGYSFGNMPLRALTVSGGQRVRWYIMDGLNDFDFHTPHWHGNTVVITGTRTDVASLAPMQMIEADMTPDNPGIWLLHCHVSFHNELGMNVRYKVER